MTAVKINGKVAAKVAEALAPHAEEMFDQRAGRWMAVVEFEHDERTEPGTAEDDTGTPGKPAAVKLRIVAVEVADGADEHHLRTAQRALYVKRTTRGTLDDAGGQMAEQADTDLRLAAGMVRTEPAPSA